ncbi:MAG: pyruvate kinase [Planctomycetes bacterium]|nr:pyruvate kinase [Planctomycetota bacterium]
MNTKPHETYRRTRIVCTIGPASSDPAVLERMIRAGMDVARLNFSHGNHESHSRTLKLIREAAAKAGRPVGVLQDLCGPKIRVGEMPGGAVEIKDGQDVEFFTGSPEFGAPANGLPCEYDGLVRDVKASERVLFDDGALEARATEVLASSVRMRFTRGGVLKSRKGMNLPGVNVSAPSVTPKDLQDLEWGLTNGVDFVALSFVRRPEDLDPVRARLAKESDPPLLISKIEKPEAIARLEEIVHASDGVMVARGDLGVEMDFEKVPPIQKRLIRIANELDKPVITATQMLESMTQNARPTRAEVSDVSNAIFDGTDAVMLSGESASGKYPVEAVEAMASIAREAERYLLSGHVEQAFRPGESMASNLHDALALGVERIARSIEVKAIVVVSRSGETARFVASSRPRVPVLALSSAPRALHRMTLFWGVTPVAAGGLEETGAVLRHAEEAVRKCGLAGGGDTIVVAVGREESKEFSGRIHIHRIEKEHHAPGSARKDAPKKS